MSSVRPTWVSNPVTAAFVSTRVDPVFGFTQAPNQTPLSGGGIGDVDVGAEGAGWTRTIRRAEAEPVSEARSASAMADEMSARFTCIPPTAPHGDRPRFRRTRRRDARPSVPPLSGRPAGPPRPYSERGIGSLACGLYPWWLTGMG